MGQRLVVHVGIHVCGLVLDRNVEGRSHDPILLFDIAFERFAHQITFARHVRLRTQHQSNHHTLQSTHTFRRVRLIHRHQSTRQNSFP